MNRRHFNSRGFTLIELMIVVVIIGILAAMAIPRFMTAAVKSKQSEAKLILKQIFVNECAYYQQGTSEYYIPAADASKDNPLAFVEIWVEIMPAARYTYSITSNDPNTDFLATATGNIDEDATDDVWTIDQTGNLVNTVSDVTTP